MKKSILGTIILLSLSSMVVAQTKFAEPVFLKIDDAPMNESGEMMYPSPVIFDIDNDGKDEMVVGTIFGGIFSCENSGEANAPVWEAPQPVNSTEGQPLELNNW